MTLKQCTREELIFIIERLMFYSFSNDYYLNMALRDVEDQRFDRKIEESQRLSKLSAQKRRAAVDLMKPYEGTPLSSVPASVLKKADVLLKEAREADRKWFKLNGIGAAKGRSAKHET